MFDLIDTAFYLGPDNFLPLIPRIEKLISVPPEQNNIGTDPLRIFFAGSILTSNDRFITSLIEQESDAIITSDLTCSGVRWFYHSYTCKSCAGYL